MPKADFFERFGIFVREDFLDADRCARLCRELDASASVAPARVTSQGDDAVRTESRSTRVVKLSNQAQADVVRLFKDQSADIARHFDVELDTFEAPQCLLYREGDFFRAHTDSSDHPDALDYIRDRKVSLVLFLNSYSEELSEGCFGGGELVLYDLLDGPAWEGKGFPLEASAGLLVGFRSDMMHEVWPVLHGQRYAMVAWFH